jgi:hypothetical protein
MADELMTKVEKQMEGTNLALAAVAEVLQKMDARFSNDEEAEIRKEEETTAASERTALVKEIASEVFGILKQGGLDVDGTKVRSAGKIGKPSSADDSEKPASISSNIADQQATIQAMKKQKEEEEEEEEEEELTPKGGYMKTDAPEDDDEEEVEKEGADEYPAKEDEPEGEEDEMKSMRKELKALKKQIRNVDASMEKAISKEAESRLRKMGFREENGLQRPQRVETPLGVDGSTPLVKTGSSTDTVEQLTGMSYKQLRDLQAQIEMGNTEGVPRELLG